MGKEKRARQKAGTQARRAAQAEAAARTKKRRTIIKVGVIVLAVLGIILGITLSGRDDADESAATPPPPVGAEVVAEPDAEVTADPDDGGSEESDATGDESDGADMGADDGTSDDSTAAGSNAADDATADDATTDDTADDATTDDATTDDTADDATADDVGIDDATGGGPAYAPYAAGDYGVEPCAPAAGAGEQVLDFDGPPMLCIDPAVAHTAVFDTSRGVVRVALDVANTPGTVNSFVNLARFGYYDGTLVHRSDPSLGILQGGSPHTNSNADPGPGYTLWDEGTGFTYRPGQLAMARRGDPNSAGAQYFFTVTDNADRLDNKGTYVVFGEVVEGLDVLEDILASHVNDPASHLGGAPDPPVVVNTLTIEAG